MVPPRNRKLHRYTPIYPVLRTEKPKVVFFRSLFCRVYKTENRKPTLFFFSRVIYNSRFICEIFVFFILKTLDFDSGLCFTLLAETGRFLRRKKRKTDRKTYRGHFRFRFTTLLPYRRNVFFGDTAGRCLTPLWKNDGYSDGYCVIGGCNTSYCPSYSGVFGTISLKRQNSRTATGATWLNPCFCLRRRSVTHKKTVTFSAAVKGANLAVASPTNINSVLVPCPRLVYSPNDRPKPTETDRNRPTDRPTDVLLCTSYSLLNTRRSLPARLGLASQGL